MDGESVAASEVAAVSDAVGGLDESDASYTELVRVKERIASLESLLNLGHYDNDTLEGEVAVLLEKREQIATLRRLLRCDDDDSLEVKIRDLISWLEFGVALRALLDLGDDEAVMPRVADLQRAALNAGWTPTEEAEVETGQS
jgi:hypothetical protein